MYYGHLGQASAAEVEVVNGVQRLTRELRDYAVGVLASMYAAAGLDPTVPAITAASDVFSGYTFYTREAYEARFPGVQLPSPGLNPVSSIGYTVIINVDDLLRFGQALAAQQGALVVNAPTIRVVVAPDAAQAATIATPGSEWALLESAPIAAVPVEKKGVSPVVVAAGLAAAAVAAVLIFS